MKLNNDQSRILDALMSKKADETVFSWREIFDTAVEVGLTEGKAFTFANKFPKVKRGVYNLSAAVAPLNPTAKVVEMPAPNKVVLRREQPEVGKVQSTSSDEVYVPEKVSTFVQWGHFTDLKKIISSNMFYPTYIAGLSGNGKTFMVEQTCAQLKREYVRVQITPETDEDDLIGGFRLLNGETVFAKGPVVKAMEAGAILLIDEIDRGSNKLMCLQGVLEGKPVLIKKTGEVVTPAPGFNVIATANTKGKGDEAGRFISATIIDEAFLERFTITLEQPYPTAATEKKIVLNHMSEFGATDEEYAEQLIKWSVAIRKTFEDGGVDEIVSTRRLCHIVQTFSIFNDRKKAVEMCVNRFDGDTKAAFIDLYEKIAGGEDLGLVDSANTETQTADDTVPF
jgi:cobaltochelatase CobS